ncbi:MOSC domain-containing protein [Pararhizobium gei]|uniref:MOSC domain-containing protein n=1 Tax=Pararhizobium gei TaxID=1395951 RepID=UPI0023DAD03F|nr:MOSC N-terminal beta barrel domain-containing protein [Rhizobium gei]
MRENCAGTVESLWRYPVSSLGGESLDTLTLDRGGVVGDRIYGLVDAQTGRPAAPEKDARWRPVLFLRSRTAAGTVEIGFPDGEWHDIGSGALNGRLSEYLGFPVAVRSYGKPGSDPDIAIAVNRYVPSPLHILTTASLRHCARLTERPFIDVRRFRPTVLLTTRDVHAFLESAWIGTKITVGTVVAHADEETKRCGMTLIAQPGLKEDADLLRGILRHNRRNLGIYCSVATGGNISLGDELFSISEC